MSEKTVEMEMGNERSISRAEWQNKLWEWLIGYAWLEGEHEKKEGEMGREFAVAVKENDKTTIQKLLEEFKTWRSDKEYKNLYFKGSVEAKIAALTGFLSGEKKDWKEAAGFFEKIEELSKSHLCPSCGDFDQLVDNAIYGNTNYWARRMKLFCLTQGGVNNSETEKELLAHEAERLILQSYPFKKPSNGDVESTAIAPSLCLVKRETGSRSTVYLVWIKGELICWKPVVSREFVYKLTAQVEFCRRQIVIGIEGYHNDKQSLTIPLPSLRA